MLESLGGAVNVLLGEGANPRTTSLGVGLDNHEPSLVNLQTELGIGLGQLATASSCLLVVARESRGHWLTSTGCCARPAWTSSPTRAKKRRESIVFLWIDKRREEVDKGPRAGAQEARIGRPEIVPGGICQSLNTGRSALSDSRARIKGPGDMHVSLEAGVLRSPETPESSRERGQEWQAQHGFRFNARGPAWVPSPCPYRLCMANKVVGDSALVGEKYALPDIQKQRGRRERRRSSVEEATFNQTESWKREASSNHITNF